MLHHLRVVNLGVLEDAAIDPAPGYTVITGETGAGKTLLLGGLRLILGAAADSNAVGPFSDQTRVDGLFGVGDTEVGASRVIPGDGRSRAYLDGSIVSAATLGERFGRIVEIVGQHDQLSITRRSHVLEVLDGAVDDAGEKARAEYRLAWSALEDALRRQEQLGGDEVELTRELDLARYQANEIEAAGLETGLDELLETQVSRLRNVEEIREHLFETYRSSQRMSDLVGEMVARLRKAAGLDPGIAALAADAEGLAAGVADLARETRDRSDGLEDDPEALAELEARLTGLGELKRKYGRTLDEVIAYGDSTEQRVSELERLIADADQIDAQLATARASVRDKAGLLSEARHRAAEAVSARMMRHLQDLGLGSAVVHFGLEPVEPGPGGADRAELLYATDARFQPEPVRVVASGGELSRLVLAVRLATSDESSTTLVFDEVDTGIGGATALAMGRKLAELAHDGQVLCVTHLPQVAAHADAHFVVDRVDGVGKVRQVSGEERVTEITRMLAGQPESDAGKTAAAELLEMASR